jgi:hypothetical protein
MQQYGQVKLRYDPSTLSYLQDLALGQQAAARSGLTLEESIALLPRLWQYTLLQGRLTNRADDYPEKGFRLLVLLEREQEALGLVELLTNLSRKAQMLCIIAEGLRMQGYPQTKWLELLMKAHKVTLMIEKKEAKAWALRILGSALAKAQHLEEADGVWREAEQAINDIEESHMRAEALRALGEALAEVHQMKWAIVQWTEAEQTITTIERSDSQVWALLALGDTLSSAQQLERAKVVWAKAKKR